MSWWHSAVSRLKLREHYRRSAPWLPVFFFWVFQVALTSTASGAAGHEMTRQESLQKSVIAWTVWAALAPIIVAIDRWLPLSREAIFKRLFIHIPFSLFFTALNVYADAISTALLVSRHAAIPAPWEIVHGSFGGQFQSRFVVYWLVLFVYITIDYSRHLGEREVRTSELERLVSEARMESLRARLHPHFLFNTLNTISAHVEREPRTARRMLEQLGELLRLSLDHADDQEIPLEQEIAFIERYLDLQKTRFEERLITILKVEPDVLDALVPTFVLQPLVENAIRYSTAERLGISCVEVQAWEEGGYLRLRVLDDGPGLPPGWDPERDVGIGISNTRERLRRLYGDREQYFSIRSEPGKGVQVDLTFPLRAEDPRQTALVTDYGQHSRIGG
jgi:two-component system, LytTR family, sensor kinase